jgi:hypothetical protein
MSKTNTYRPNVFSVAAAALATVIAIGIFTLVADLFQSRGAPLAQLAAAERACAARVYVSERETCMKEWLAASHGNSVARR